MTADEQQEKLSLVHDTLGELVSSHPECLPALPSVIKWSRILIGQNHNQWNNPYEDTKKTRLGRWVDRK